MSRLLVIGVLLATAAAGTAPLALASMPDPAHSSVAWRSNAHIGACAFPDICPKGDSVGPPGARYVAVIDIYVRDQFGAPMAGIAASEIDAEGTCVLGGGSPCTQVLFLLADTPTDQTGHTTITVARAGGCCSDLSVRARGITLNVLTYRSFDYTADLAANLSGLGYLADTYNKPNGQPGYNACFDFNCDNIVNLSDLGTFADHYNHVCT